MSELVLAFTILASIVGWHLAVRWHQVAMKWRRIADDRWEMLNRCEGRGEPRDNGQEHGYGAEFGGCV